MGGACGTYEGHDRDHLEDLGLAGRIILKLIFREMSCGGMDWLDLAQGRDRWRARLDTVMNLRVP